MSMRIALLTLLLAACATEQPAKQDPAMAQRLGGQCASPPPAVDAEGKPVLKLEKQHVQPAMRCTRRKSAMCYDRFQQQGMAKLELLVGPEGGAPRNVTMAADSEIPGTTPEGTCLVDAMREARFPTYGGEPQTITWPIMLR